MCLFGWILSWFGLRERQKVYFSCPGCNYQKTTIVYCRPGENALDIIQKEVQDKFKRKYKKKYNCENKKF
jgi:hypothetical protein